MKTGPRLFALVVLIAVALLPKTGWIVRNEIDMLAGRWGHFADSAFLAGPIPQWAFASDIVRDPAAQAVAEPTQTHETAQDRWARIRPIVRDASVRARVRASVLRRAFTSILPAQKRPEIAAKVRDLARELLPLAKEGERSDPFNAFYPTCRAVLEDVLGNPEEAAKALTRAASATYYDDEVWNEVGINVKGIEREHGYRGSNLRLVRAGMVLLPQYAAFNSYARKRTGTASMTDPVRRELLELGRKTLLTSENRIGIHVGRSLILIAVGKGDRPDEKTKVDEAFVAFERENPGVETGEYKRLAKAVVPDDLFVYGDIESDWAALATCLGAAFLLGLVVSGVFLLGGKRVASEEPSVRVRRANWAWLALIPAALLDERHDTTLFFSLFSLGAVAVVLLSLFPKARKVAVGLATLLALGGLALIPYGAYLWGGAGLLWLVSALASDRVRPYFAGAMLFASALAFAAHAFRASHISPEHVILGAASLAAALRGTLAARGGLAYVPAALAGLWLLAVGAELAADARAAAVLEAFRREGDTYRRTHRI